MYIDVIIQTDEYIPLKVIFSRPQEVVKYISYSKDSTSYLEFAIGKFSKQIVRMLLLLSKEYSIVQDKLELNDVYNDNFIFINENNISCLIFKTYIYSNGIKILLSDKECYKHIKTDKVYFGVSNTNELTDVCIYNLSDLELYHIKKELELQ
ncbi:MAG: hypothetical protein J1F64_07705 [Oscillospiraceae bacterium]|nr:hypothetical protein [Oscillospiraceae bacterium]